MNWQLAETGEFSGNGTLKTGEKSFDVKFRLVTSSRIDIGTAWNISWNQMILKHGKFRGAKLRTVSVDGKGENWGQVFDVTGHYAKLPKEEEEEKSFASLQFNTMGGKEKKVHSYATVSYPAVEMGFREGAVPDFRHGIGFNNGIFQGVDITVPAFGFSISATLPAEWFSDAQLVYFHNLTGSVNAEPFWIFPKGSCLFTGLRGNTLRKRNAETEEYELHYSLSFEFEAGPNIQNAHIPPFQGITKEGMQYMWVFHADQKDETSGITIPCPLAAYVETVYPYGDFSWFSTLQW